MAATSCCVSGEVPSANVHWSTPTPLKSPFHEPLRWKSTGPLIQPVSDENHHLVSIKDPTIVQYGGKWHIYATVANTARQWSMVYLSFTDWSEAGSAKQVYLDVANPGLRGTF